MLASSEILTPHPLTAGGGHTRWGERGWGVNSSEDARHCSVLYICKYFVGGTMIDGQWQAHQIKTIRLYPSFSKV
jgi:hypothetical protein